MRLDRAYRQPLYEIELMNKSKMLKTAKEYLRPYSIQALYDCSDSMEDADRLEARFDAYADDSIKIEAFIQKNLRDELVNEFAETLKEFSSVETKEAAIEEMVTAPLPIKDKVFIEAVCCKLGF